MSDKETSIPNTQDLDKILQKIILLVAIVSAAWVSTALGIVEGTLFLVISLVVYALFLGLMLILYKK